MMKRRKIGLYENCRFINLLMKRDIMKKFYWKGICKDDRIRMISRINEIIEDHGAILNFQRFSDISLSMVIEVDPGKLLSLHEKLEAVMSLQTKQDISRAPAEGAILFLNVTFASGSGELEIEIPDIPK